MTGQIELDDDLCRIGFCPREVVLLIFVMSISSVLQAIGDFSLEGLSFFEIIPKIPLRLEFMYLTLISAVLGQFTLWAIRKRELDVTIESVILSFLVETALVTSDLFFLYTHPEMNLYLIFLRTPFIVLTSINILILAYSSWKLKLFVSK
jgi:hypothetical protein